MGLILCEGEEVDRPLYIEALNINIYSIEELCYLIYDNPILVTENFVGEGLFDFIDDSLGLSSLSAWLLKIYKERKLNDDILYYILEYSGFYTKLEIAKYKHKIDTLRSMPKEEYLKEQGDYLFYLKKYGKATDAYERALGVIKEGQKNQKLLGLIHNNLAAAYANMFRLEPAYMNYARAYECLRDKSILKKIFFLEKLGLGKNAGELAELSSMETESWNNEFLEDKKDIEDSEAMKNLRNIFRSDSIKRANMIKRELNTLKQEYRSMI